MLQASVNPNIDVNCNSINLQADITTNLQTHTAVRNRKITKMVAYLCNPSPTMTQLCAFLKTVAFC